MTKNIIISHNDLYKKRGSKIQTCLEPLISKSRPLAYAGQSIHGGYIIGIHDGPRPTTDYRDWRFATTKSRFRGMYFEKWVPENSSNTFYLDRAYFSLFKINNYNSIQEILCLHCDPNEPVKEKHFKYKQGPHLHIKLAPEPIPHAHIALALGAMNTVLSSVDDLSQALKNSVEMIKDQFLDLTWSS